MSPPPKKKMCCHYPSTTPYNFIACCLNGLDTAYRCPWLIYWFRRHTLITDRWTDRQDKTRLHHYLCSDTSCIECFLYNSINVLSMKVLSQRRNHTTISRKIMPIGHTLVGTMVMVYQGKLFVIRGIARWGGGLTPQSEAQPPWDDTLNRDLWRAAILSPGQPPPPAPPLPPPHF